jgi:hypothetical protein
LVEQSEELHQTLGPAQVLEPVHEEAVEEPVGPADVDLAGMLDG